MAHHTTHRRNLAASDPNTSMDPTSKKHPNFTTTTTTTTTTPHPDLAVDSSKPHTNHKPIVASSSLIKSTRQRRRKTAPIKSSKESHEVDDIKRALANIKTDDEIKESPSSKKEAPENQESGVMGFGEGCEKKMASVSLGAMGRRRSFCNSESELAGFFSCSGVKVVSADMPPFMQIHAVDFARKAYDSLEKFTAKTLALSLKKEFDGVYGPAWHCIVGTSFGSFVTHSVGGFLYFSMDHKLYVLLFKTTVQRAD